MNRLRRERRFAEVLAGGLLCVAFTGGAATADDPAAAPQTPAATTAGQVDDQPVATAAELMAQVDHNGDGRLDAGEALASADLPAETHAVYPRHRAAFATADVNGDESVTIDELVPTAELFDVIATERWIRHTAWPRFKSADTSGDLFLQRDEWLAATKTEELRYTERDLVLLDFNRDSRISFDEYLCRPSLPLARRAPVPDPWAMAAQAEMDRVWASVIAYDQNADGLLQQSEWAKAGEREWCGLHFSLIDRNGDQAVSRSELAAAGEVFYGLRHTSGLQLRLEHGLQFNWRYFQYRCDHDANGVLSLQEFRASHSGDQSAKDLQFERADQNHDGELTIAEYATLDSAWIDTLIRYVRLDADRDGIVSAEELSQRTDSWESAYVGWAFPMFDLYADGGLSLEEYQLSPLGQAVLRWEDISSDATVDGRITLSEFHPRPDGAWLGVSRSIFSRLDRDQDGVLGLQELDLDWNRISAESLLASLDADHDGRLVLAEAFPDLAKSDGASPTGDRRPIGPQSDTIMQRLSSTADGGLRLDSALGRDSLARVLAVEHTLQTFTRHVFGRLDRDQSSGISLEEWLTGIAEARRDADAYGFRLADADGDQQLTLLEFAATRRATRAGTPLWVPDPLVDKRDAFLAHLRSAPGDSVSEMADSLKLLPQSLGVTAADVAAWDLDRDGRLSPEESQHGLNIAFGICDRWGAEVRLPNGRVYYSRSPLAWDKNTDGRLQRREFEPNYGRDPAAATALFDSRDSDRDGILTVDESHGIESLWRDLIAEFERFDADHDAGISSQELQEQAKSYELKNAQLTFPAFDADGDGRLSFREFRLSPLANPAVYWDRPRMDRDFDDQLSIAEFHATDEPALRGLSGLFFERFDLDQSGALSGAEFASTVDLKAAPAEVVFRLFDKDADGKLSVHETLHGRGIEGTQSWKMRTEDAFYAADMDRDGVLTVAEFTKPGLDVAALAVGKLVTQRTPRGRGSAAGGSGDNAAEQPWDWKLIGLFLVNAVVVGVVGWGFFRQSSKE